MRFRSLLFVLISLLVVRSGYGADRDTYGKIPLSFEANVGQADKHVRFLSRGAGYGLFFTDGEAILRLTQPRSAAVRMRLAGQNRGAKIAGIDPLPGKTHYLRGGSPAAWHGDVPTYGRVRYSGVYPGIDVIYYGNQRQLEYDFVVTPGARPDVIQLRFDGIKGIEIDDEGQLVLKTPDGRIVQRKPVIYQDGEEGRTLIEGGYVLQGRNRVGFKIASYDSAKPLVIDPVLVYSTYFGGTGTADQANAVAIDAAGNAYVTGQTSSTDLLIVNGQKSTLDGQLDGFVLKLDPTGTTVIYSTYFGGSALDEGHSVAVDVAGNAYVTGYTTSTDFPVVNGFQKTRSGGVDAYILKLNAAGNAILFSSYLGGTGDDRAFGLALDTFGNVYIAGSTTSTNFPTANPIQRTNAGGLDDVFVMKIGFGGNVIYSTYVGGFGQDTPLGIAVDFAGAAYVAGYSSSAINFPVVNPLRTTCPGSIPPICFGGGTDDAFVFKVNAAGTALEYSTFLGGAGSDEATRITVDSSGSAYITGYTQSPDFPLVTPYQAALSASFDAFIARLAPDGKSLVFSTFFGGLDTDSGTGIALDQAGNIFVSGYTSSFDLPVVNATQNFIGGNRDAFVSKWTPDGGTIIFSTYLGGLGTEAAVGLAIDPAGSAVVVGLTSSTDFPVMSGFQPVNSTGQDAFISKINIEDIVATAQFQIAEQGGASFTTRGTRTDAVFGYATAEPASPDERLNGLAIIDHQESGAVVTEVGIPAPPFITVGRMYADALNSRSVLSIENPNDTDATVDFFFTDSAGTTSNFATVTVAAHQHFSRFVTDDPILIPLGAEGALNFTSSLPVAATGFRTLSNEGGEFLLSNTPIADPYAVSNAPVVLPQFAEGASWNTQVILVNTSEDRMNGGIRFLDPNGSPVEVGIGDAFASELEYDIPARSAQRIQTAGTTTKSDFPFTTKSGFSLKTPGDSIVQLNGFAVAAVGSPNTQLNGLQIQEFHEGNTVISTTGVLAPPLRINGAVFVEASTSVRSMIAFANTSDTDVATVDLTFTDAAGTAGSPVSISVPTGGQIFSFLSDPPVSIPSGSVGALTFTSSIPISASAFRFFTTEDSKSLVSAIPIADAAKLTNQPVVIPQFADGAGWNSQINLVNTTDEEMGGEVRFFSPGSGTTPGSPIAVGIGDSDYSAVEYLVPAHGAQRIETTGIADDLRTGSVYVVPFAGFNTPHAHALENLHGAGITVLQTPVEGQVPANSFRLYAEAFGDFDAAKAKSTRTAVAFANPSDSVATVRLDLADLNGTALGSSLVQVPPSGNIAMFLNQIPGFGSLKAPFQGVLRATVTSGTGVAALGLRAMYNEVGTFIATTTGPFDEAANASQNLVFPYVTDSAGYTTQIILTSTSPNASISGVVRFVSTDGSPLQIADLRVGSIQVIPFAGFNTPHAHAILAHQVEGITIFQTSTEGRQPASTFRIYAEASGDIDAAAAGATRTSVSFANPADTPASVRLDLVGFDGKFLGNSGSISVPPNGQVGLFLDQVPGFEKLALPFQGIIRANVTSGSGLTAAGFRTRVNERGRSLMTTTGPLYEDAGSPAMLVFPHIAEGAGYTTQIIVVGAATGKKNSGTLRFLNQQGAPLNVTLADQ